MKRKMRKYRDYLIEELCWPREGNLLPSNGTGRIPNTDGDSVALHCCMALRSVVEAQGGIQDEYQFDYSKAKPIPLCGQNWTRFS